MNTTTKIRSAAACASFVRLPRAGQRLFGPTMGDQGTALSIATSIVTVRSAVADSVFTGVVRRSDVSFVYKTSDVVRSLSGRPPV